MKRRAKNINSYFQRRPHRFHWILVLALICFTSAGTPNEYIETATVQTKSWKIEQVPVEVLGKPTTKHGLMAWSIKKYSDEYNVPIRILQGVARIETGYLGSTHVGYNPHRVSRCGAVGPMQIMPRYAAPHAGRKVTSRELKYDIELNVKVSASMLRVLYDRYGSWLRALGAYSTGRPRANKYAYKVMKWHKS